MRTGTENGGRSPRPLFRAKFKIVDIGYPYDVTSDGKRFLVNEFAEEEQPEAITVIQNWTERLNLSRNN